MSLPLARAGAIAHLHGGVLTDLGDKLVAVFAVALMLMSRWHSAIRKEQEQEEEQREKKPRSKVALLSGNF